MEHLAIVDYDWCVEQPKLNKKDFATTALISSGVFVTTWNSASDDSNAHLNGKPVICIEKKVKTLLSAREYNAILLHEHGHYNNGDLQLQVSGIINSLEAELAADAYAIKHGANPAAMISALNKIVWLMLTRLIPGDGMAARACRMLVLATIKLSPSTRKRFSALRAYA